METAVTPPPDRRYAVSLFSRLRTAKGQANLFPIYAELRSRGGVIAAPWGGHLVTTFDLCDQVLRNRNWPEPDSRWRERQGSGTRWTAPSSQEMSRTLPALNPPEHTWVRRAAGMFDRSTLQQIVFTQELLPSASQLAKSDAATAELRTYFMDLVRERRARPGDHVLSWSPGSRRLGK